MDEQLEQNDAPEADERQHLRRVFARVMIVQVIALVALWLLQSRFGTG